MARQARNVAKAGAAKGRSCRWVFQALGFQLVVRPQTARGAEELAPTGRRWSMSKPSETENSTDSTHLNVSPVFPGHRPQCLTSLSAPYNHESFKPSEQVLDGQAQCLTSLLSEPYKHESFKPSEHVLDGQCRNLPNGKAALI